MALKQYSSICVAIILLLSAYYQADGARFLGIGMPFKSQLIEIQALFLELADRGHEVYIVIGQHAVPGLPRGFFDDRIQILSFKTRSDEFLNPENPEVQKNGIYSYFENPMDRTFPFKTAQVFGDFTRVFSKNYTADMLKDEKFNRKLLDLKIDMAIVHNAILFFPTAYLLPMKHNIPYVSVSGFPLRQSGVPFLPSINPSPLTSFSDDMSFWQRTVNFLVFFPFNFMLSHSIPYDYHAETLEGVPRKTYNQILTDSELFIITGKHPALDFPQLTLPNTIFAGGMSTKPGKPLQKDLEAFMKQHKNGVIVVSFGSIVNFLPDYVIEKMAEAFSKIKYGVIWKHTGRTPKAITENVKLLSWLPQNDLLAHSNTKLFISHCGLGGSFESFYHGIPVIGFPLNGDQYYNSYRAQHRGIAKVMDILYFTPDELTENIYTMIQNTSFINKAKKLSRIFQDQPWTPQQQAAFWLEHVLKHGGSYLHSPTASMPWYQYYMLDVITFLLSVCISLMTLCIMSCKSCCGRCCRNTTPTKVKTK